MFGVARKSKFAVYLKMLTGLDLFGINVVQITLLLRVLNIQYETHLIWRDCLNWSVRSFSERLRGVQKFTTQNLMTVHEIRPSLRHEFCCLADL